MKLYSFRGKRTMNSEQRFFSLITASLLSVCLSMVCFAGSSWAWFVANQSVGVQPMESAKVFPSNVQVTTTERSSEVVATTLSAGNEENTTFYSNSDVELATSPDGLEYSFAVQANKVYYLSADLNKTGSTGYLLLITPEGIYYTTSGIEGLSLCFAQGGDVSVSAHWGEMKAKALPLPEDGAIGTGTVAVEVFADEVVVMPGVDVYPGVVAPQAPEVVAPDVPAVMAPDVPTVMAPDVSVAPVTPVTPVLPPRPTIAITPPEITEPDVIEPEVTEHEVTEPEVTEPEVAEPEVTEPEVTEPEVTEPEVAEPEVAEPEVTEPEVTEPDTTEPETTEPETTEPEEEAPAQEPAPDQE